jgi:hypothetical protein
LIEPVDILLPFLEATNHTQGEKSVTISYVLPSILSLHTHLIEMKSKIKLCASFADALLQSLVKRFNAVFRRVGMYIPKKKKSREEESEDGESEEVDTSAVPEVEQREYGLDIYLLSTVLDPRFKLEWINTDVVASAATKEKLTNNVTGKS